MAKKPKHGMPTLTASDLKTRVDRAMKEGRFQQALELAKQLARQEPTPAHDELLRQAYLGRIHQLRSLGQTRDARTLLDHVLQLGHGEAGWLGQLAVELAALGDVRRALELAQRQPDPQLQTRVLNLAADAAVERQAAGRALLPEALQGPYDLVLKAFGEVEAGADDAARATLQGIGLQSPFLEWKLLLRGLQAYYQNDDVRAVENWGRLRPERLPARLAAPLRFSIDPAYRTAQAPETQVRLQHQADRLQAAQGVAQSLRALQNTLSHEQLPQAFRLAEGVVATLQRDAPQLVPRLAKCFLWAIIQFGDHPDLQRYKRVFGAPADDPDLARLEALALERRDDINGAHEFWQRYERQVASRAATDGTAAKVRALIWSRMGDNAADVPDADMVEQLPPFLRNHPDRPLPLNPSAEKCYLRSLELDPDRLEPYEALMGLYRRGKKEDKAEKIARRLLEHFPEHVPTLEALADLRQARRDYAEAVTLYQRALKVQPLDRRLRGKLSAAHAFLARSHVEAGRFDAARAEYQTALAISEGSNTSSLYCRWAACEFKAGNAERAEELLLQARTEAGHALPVVYQVLVEAIRMKLLAAIKKRFEQEFTAALDEPPSAPGVVLALETAASVRQLAVKYHGQKTHEKKLLGYLERVPAADFTETQLVDLGKCLLHLQDMKTLRKYTERGRKRFPRNPHLLLLEADSYLLPKPKRTHSHKVWTLLDRAKALAEALPAGEQQKELLEQIDKRQAMIGAAGMFGRGSPLGFLGDLFGRMNIDVDDGSDD